MAPLSVSVAGRGICMMSTSWRDKQDHHLINFIGVFQDFIFNNGGLSVAFIFETNWDCGNGAAVFSRVNALKRQYKNLYVFVAVPTVEQIKSFNQSYFKYGMELGCPTFVPVNDSEMGFEMMLKIAHARGVCKQQDISSTMRNEREQAVQSMDAYIRVLTSIPGIDDHDANMDVELRYRYIFNHFPILADEDVIGKTDHEILSGEGIDEMNKVKREVMAKGIPIKREFLFNTPLFGPKTFVNCVYFLELQVKTREKMADIRVREAVQKAKETEHSRSPNITESIDGILGLSKVESGISKNMTYPNPLEDNTAYSVVKQYFVNPDDIVCQKLYFEPDEVYACIVTCGGLCPGLNTVIREIVCGLSDMYGVTKILGIQGGYRGFYARNTIVLTPKSVNDIHKRGGTILGSSRGGHDTMKIVDSIQYRGINQIKTFVLADFTDFSGDYKPFSRDVVNRVLKIIWSNLEDPLSQTVKQVHLIFDLLLDIESSLPSEDQSVKLVMCDIANDLLRLGCRSGTTARSKETVVFTLCLYRSFEAAEGW
ncbi:ATP-dependent 6-phosphofructokinase 1 [Hordeum vulgare]|nr:ATP-dependent 6-phosphofructokinase 1 [Hordeum vulgare]